MKKLIFLGVVASVLVACDSNSKNKSEDSSNDNPTKQKQTLFETEEERDFPEKQSLSNFEGSRFVSTLESDFKTDKNTIYAATLCYAWDEIRDHYKENIKDIDCDALEELNSSDAFRDVLSEDEIKTDIEIEGQTIKASAFFSISLPYEKELDRKYNFQFKEDKVKSFGCWGANYQIRILHYQNDNDFAIRIQPKPEDHEIIIVKKNFGSKSTFEKEYQKLEKEIEKFQSKKNNRNDWKYYLEDDDQVTIPVIAFNLEHSFEELIGCKFVGDDRSAEIEKAYQRNAFILDEKGAEVESEAEIAATEAAIEEEDARKPKKLFANKDFIIFLKRKDAKYPYFSMFVANSELMKKEE